MTKVLEYMGEQVECLIRTEECGGDTNSLALVAASGMSKSQNLYGFDIPVDLVTADHFVKVRAARLVQIKRYRDDAAVLRSRIGSAGVEPIAMITAKAFDRLVDEMGLFTLQPSNIGKVQVSRDKIIELRGSSYWFNTLATLAVLVLSAAAAWLYWLSVWNVMTDANLVWLFVLSVFIFSAMASIGAATSSKVHDAWFKRRFARRVGAYLNSVTWCQLLEDLSFNGNGYRRCFLADFQGTEFSRTVVLPPAPSDIVEVVRRCSKLDDGIRIAAEADAISFRDGVRGLFDLDAINRQLELERRIAADPILYVRYNNAVAVLAQYGDFPAELEVIDRIVNSEHLL